MGFREAIGIKTISFGRWSNTKGDLPGLLPHVVLTILFPPAATHSVPKS